MNHLLQNFKNSIYSIREPHAHLVTDTSPGGHGEFSFLVIRVMSSLITPKESTTMEVCEKYYIIALTDSNIAPSMPTLPLGVTPRPPIKPAHRSLKQCKSRRSLIHSLLTKVFYTLKSPLKLIRMDCIIFIGC